MDTRSYDLEISKFYEKVTEAWEKWGNRPENPYLRLGTLEEPTSHPEYPEILESLKPSEIMTDGRILGTPADPRRQDVLEATKKCGAKVILRWSGTTYCQKALRSLKDSGVKVILGITIGEELGVSKFLETLWKESGDYLLIPETEKTEISPDDLKDKGNIQIMKYNQCILLRNDKIIITKNKNNLKPLHVYDRV